MPDAQIPEVTNGSFNYHCTADGCNYSKRDLYGIVLHMRTHFVYETAKSDMDRATFAFQNGRYQCFDCDRNTNSMLSFKEHVRHHILKYPYMCGHCMASVGSICELRKHSSSDHPKTPLQLRFAEMNGQLNTIMSSLGPVRQTFTFGAECEAVDHSSSHSLSTDCDIVCSESFAQMNEGPIYNVSPTKIVAPVQRREDDLPQQQSKSFAVEPNLHNKLLSRNVMKNAHGKHRKCVRKSLLTSEQKSNEKVTDRVGIGKFTFTDNKFQCLTCKFGTLSEYAFQKHVGVHFHSGDSRICRNSCADGHCPFVFGILMAISSIRHLPASKASNISSLRRKSLGNTNNEVDAHKNAPIALEIPDLTSSPLQDLSNSISASKSTERQFPEQQSPDNGAKDSDSILKVVPSEQLSSALRFSQKNLASLRSKAGELLDLSNIANDRAVLESEEQAPKHVDNSGVGEETNQNSESSVKASTSEFFIIDSDDSADSGPNDKQGQKRKSDSSLLGYFEFVHDSTPLSTLCKRCSYTCNCKVQLKYHQDTCHNALQDRKHEFHCPECFFSGNSKQILIWHMAHHIGSHSLTFCICGFCSYQTSSVPHIKKHLRHQHPNRSVDFKTEDSKVDYMDGIFKCPVCNAGFPWGNLFFRHVASQHGSQELADYLHAIYGEKVCPELIRIPKVLLPNVPGRKVSPSAHSTKNEANEVFYCFKCDIGFKTSDDLIKHCSGHTKDHGEKMGDADKATDCVVLCDETVIDPKQVKKPSSNIVQSTIKQLERNKLLQPKKRKWKERSKPLQSKKRKWNVKFGNSREDKNASGLVNKRLEHVAGSKCQTGILYKSRNNWIKKYKAPMAGKKSCVSDLPSSVPTLPRNLEMSSSSDFEKSLPNMYVFSEAIKCPKCYYSDRVRLNLVRHYNGHFKDSSKSGDPKDVANVNSVSESELSFSLWQPKCSTSDREINNDGQTAVDRQDSCDSDVEVSYNKTQTNDKTSTMSTKIIKITVSSGAKSGDKSNSTNAIPYFGQFLENHAKKTTKMIACYSCSETFSNDGDRDRHATSVHSSTYYVCRCCGIMVHGLSFVYKHYKEMHPGSQVLVDPWTPSWRGTQKSKIEEEASDAKIQNDNSQLSNEGRKMAGELGMNSSDQLSSATDCSISSQKKPIKDKVINAPEEQKCHSDSSQDVCITISDEVTSSDVISTSDSTAAVSTQQLGTEVSYGSSAYPINPNPVSTSPEFNINMLYSVLANVVSSRLAYNQTVPAVQMPAPSSPLVSPADVMAAAQSLLNTPQCLNLRNPQASAQIMAVQNALAIYRLQSLLAGASQPDVTQAARIVANCLMTGLSSVNAPNTWQPFSSGLAAGGSVSFSAAASAVLASGGATNISSLNEMSNESVNRVGESCRVTDILKPQDFVKTIVTEGDESSQPSISSLESTSKIQSCDSSSKLLLSDSEHFYTSDLESVSGASHCSGDSKTSRFAAASAGHSKRLAKKNHKKGHKFYSRSDISENNSDAFSANYSRVVSADAKNQEDPLNLETDPATPDPVDSKNLCFCCHCCQYSTRNRQHFKNHLSKHLFREFSVDPKSWKPIRLRCGFCSFHTFLDEEFDEHVLTHTVDKPFQCHHCSYSTFTKVSVLRHLTRFHPDLEPRFEKRKDIRVERKRHQPRDTIINFHPVVKIRNLMTLSRMDIKCLQYDHNLKKIDLKF